MRDDAKIFLYVFMCACILFGALMLNDNYQRRMCLDAGMQVINGDCVK